MAKPPVHLIRPIVYPRVGAGGGPEQRNSAELAAINTPPELNESATSEE